MQKGGGKSNHKTECSKRMTGQAADRLRESLKSSYHVYSGYEGALSLNGNIKRPDVK